MASNTEWIEEERDWRPGAQRKGHCSNLDACDREVIMGEERQEKVRNEI